ncbi:MAG: hypothetical protein R3F17_06795 [Planctomycetota bacterium]
MVRVVLWWALGVLLALGARREVGGGVPSEPAWRLLDRARGQVVTLDRELLVTGIEELPEARAMAGFAGGYWVLRGWGEGAELVLVESGETVITRAAPHAIAIAGADGLGVFGLCQEDSSGCEWVHYARDGPARGCLAVPGAEMLFALGDGMCALDPAGIAWFDPDPRGGGAQDVQCVDLGSEVVQARPMETRLWVRTKDSGSRWRIFDRFGREVPLPTGRYGSLPWHAPSAAGEEAWELAWRESTAILSDGQTLLVQPESVWWASADGRRSFGQGGFGDLCSGYAIRSP